MHCALTLEQVPKYRRLQFMELVANGTNYIGLLRQHRVGHDINCRMLKVCKPCFRPTVGASWLTARVANGPLRVTTSTTIPRQGRLASALLRRRRSFD